MSFDKQAAPMKERGTATPARRPHLGLDTRRILLSAHSRALASWAKPSFISEGPPERRMKTLHWVRHRDLDVGISFF